MCCGDHPFAVSNVDVWILCRWWRARDAGWRSPQRNYGVPPARRSCTMHSHVTDRCATRRLQSAYCFLLPAQVVAGATLEVTTAQFWSSAGEAELEQEEFSHWSC